MLLVTMVGERAKELFEKGVIKMRSLIRMHTAKFPSPVVKGDKSVMLFEGVYRRSGAYTFFLLNEETGSVMNLQIILPEKRKTTKLVIEKRPDESEWWFTVAGVVVKIKKNNEEGVLCAGPEKSWTIEFDSDEDKKHEKIFNVFLVDLKGDFEGKSIDMISLGEGAVLSALFFRVRTVET